MFLLQNTKTTSLMNEDVNLTFSGSNESEDSSVSTCSVAPAKPGSVARATPNDIIVGSRGTHHSGPGNDRFNRIIDSFIPKYNKASTKAEKGKIFLEIFETVSAFGRFLCHDPKSGEHHELGEYAAKEKISHALRYRRKRMMKEKRLQKSPTYGIASSLGQLLRVHKTVHCKTGTQLLSPRTNSPKAQHNINQESQDLFSDADMDSVLGRPGEFDWSSLSKP